MASFERVEWRKSSYSDAQNNCVEVGRGDDVTAVRDTKDRDGGVLTFDARAWASFLDGIRTGQLD
jgi:hypothetical protein